MSYFVDLVSLQEDLRQQYDKATRCVPVLPLEDDEGLPLHQLYGEVLLEEDLSVLKKTRSPNEQSGKRTLNHMKDLFYTDNKPLNRIIMKGEAGMGKTVFCLKMLESWCNSFRSDNSESAENELREVISIFHLVFYVPLRLLTEACSVVDMVCASVSGGNKEVSERVKRMLRSQDIRCLVVLDGLDEWRVPSSCMTQGFPNTHDLVNTVLFCTSRPWELLKLPLSLFKGEDKVVEILGLQHSSIEDVVRNILVNFYGATGTFSLFKERIKDNPEKAELAVLKSLLRIPMVLTTSCHLFCEKDDNRQPSVKENCSMFASYFMTCFFLSLIETMIKRAEKKHSDVALFLRDSRKMKTNTQAVPKILNGFGHIKDFNEVLKPLSQLAFNDIVSDEAHLVYEKYELERDIGRANLELALKVGLINQAKAPGRFYQQNISLNFYHKTIQEFLAALHVVLGDDHTFTSFCGNFTTIDKVMNLSYVILFIFGLDPSVGCRLSERIKNISDTDKDILVFRKTFDCGLDKVEKLYTLQCGWFQEMNHSLSYIQDTGYNLAFYVGDVYLQFMNHNSTLVKTTCDIMSSKKCSIVSVFLNEIQGSIHNIIQLLPECSHLTSLHVSQMDRRDTKMLGDILASMKKLQYITYRAKVGYGVVNALRNIKHVKCIQLQDTNLDGLLLGKPKELETIVLDNTQGSLKRFIKCLVSCSHLTSLHIIGITVQDRKCLAKVLRKLKCLTSIQYHVSTGEIDEDTDVVKALQNLVHLKHIDLGCIRLTDNNTISFEKTKLQSLMMHDIQGSLTETLSCLPRCAYLKTLNYTHNGRDANRKNRKLFGKILTGLGNLEHLKYHGERVCDDSVDSIVINGLQQLTKLKSIDLWWIKQSDKTCTTNSLSCTHMSQLEQLKMFGLEMPSDMWLNLVTSLLSVPNIVHVEIGETCIDGRTMNKIRSHPRVIVTEAINEFLCFHTT